MKNIYTLTLFLTSIGVLMLLLSNSNGNSLQDFTGAPGSNGTCANCHMGLTTGSGITLSGISTDYRPDSTYTITLTIDQPDVRHGFQLSIIDAAGNSAGTLNSGVGSIIRSIGSRSVIQHGQAQSGNSWEFTWQAPSTDVGQLTIHMSGNSANGNGTTSGDAIYNLSQVLDPENVASTTTLKAQQEEVRLIARSRDFVEVVQVPQNQNAIIVNLEGKVLKQVSLRKGNNTIKIGDLPKGYYFLKLEKNGQAPLAFVKAL